MNRQDTHQGKPESFPKFVYNIALRLLTKTNTDPTRRSVLRNMKKVQGAKPLSINDWYIQRHNLYKLEHVALLATTKQDPPPIITKTILRKVNRRYISHKIDKDMVSSSDRYASTIMERTALDKPSQIPVNQRLIIQEQQHLIKTLLRDGNT